MAFTRHYFSKFNFVYTECSGKIDDQSLMIHLMSFSRELRDFAFIKHLIDLRHLRDSSQLTANGLTRMGKMHSDMFANVEKFTAVLIATSEDKKPVEVYSQLFTGPNLKVKAFSGSFDEPLYWLGYDKRGISKIKLFLAKHARPAIE